MDSILRKADGRRIFSVEFKKEQVGRVQRGELSVAELSRELDVQRVVVSRWVRLANEGGATAVGENEAVVPVSQPRAAQARIRELEQALGRKTLENEILRAARAEVEKKPRWYGVSKP
ncbi:MAG: transposase [Candidatus Methylomirabilaceae bacterium]